MGNGNANEATSLSVLRQRTTSTLGVLSVISFRTTETEDTFLQERVASVPKGESKTQALRSIAKAGKTVLIPPIGARARVFVREILPGLAIGTVVFTHRAPRAFADVWPDCLPVTRRIRRRIFKSRVLRR